MTLSPEHLTDLIKQDTLLYVWINQDTWLFDLVTSELNKWQYLH